MEGIFFIVTKTDGFDLDLLNSNLFLLPETSINRLDNIKNPLIKIQTFAGEVVARYAVSKRFNIDYIKEDFSYNKRRKPFFMSDKNLNFNISHSKNIVACVVDNNRVGVDVEKIRNIKLNVAKRFFTTKEYEDILKIEERKIQNDYFIQLWTIKESYLKAIGKGLALELDSFSVEKNKNEFELKNNELAQKFDVYSYNYFDEAFIAVCSEKPSSKPEIRILNFFDIIDEIKNTIL